MTVLRNLQTLVSALGESLSAAMFTAESGFFAAARLRAQLRGAATAATALEPTPAAAARGGVRTKPEGDPEHRTAAPAAGPPGRRPGRRAPRARGPRPARREAW
jgi:hypothetical protein